jgi:heme/copper-type cytochrome/quinol oxidase subunit 2
MLLMLLLLLLLLFPLLLLAVRCIVRIRNHKMRQIGCSFYSSSLRILLLLLLFFPLLLLAVLCIVSFRNHKMRQLGITPLGRILIIETKAEQIRTNAFFVLQLENVRQNLVCGRVAPVVGKPFTTVLFPPSILEWSNTGVDKNLRIAFFVFSSCNSSMWVF